MKKLLHIIATPRKDISRTLQISSKFTEALKIRFPDLVIDQLDLYEAKLPELDIMRVKGKYMLLSGKELDEEAKISWKEIENHISRFLDADMIVISTPMWNFSIPYRLKHYLDIILQPGYMFKYTANGVEGLASGRKAIVVSTHGGDYGKGSASESFDQLTPYLRQIMSFIGIKDVSFVQAQPMDAGGAETEARQLEKAIKQVEKLAEQI